MAIKRKSAIELKPYLWQAGGLFLSLLIFSLVLLNRSPNVLRAVSMAMRAGFGLIIPVTALLLYISFRLPGRAGDLFSMTLTASLFALPLAGLWASGQSQSISISGLIPLSDAANYYHDSLRITMGRDISDFSAMRPFYAGFLSLLMSLTDRNFMFSMAVITFIAGIAMYYTAREVQRTHGAETAVFLLLILFLYYRHHTGTSMSETLAVPLGALGFALTWRGLQKESQTLAMLGLFVCAFALNVRPGPMFILPFMLLWLGWIFKKPGEYISWKFLLLGSCAIALSFILNSILIQILAGPSGAAFSNFSWALYGLAAGGKSFNYIAQVHPEVFALQDPERSRMIYRMTYELILQNPELLAQGLIQRWTMFFSGTWYSAFSFVGGEKRSVNIIAQWVMYGLSILGFIKWLLKPSDRYTGLVAMASIGVLLSVPFVPPTDAYRVRLYGAAIVIFGMLPGMGISLLTNHPKLKFFSAPSPEIQPLNVTAWFSVVFIALIVCGTLFVKATSPAPPMLAVNCPAGSDKIAIRLDAGSFINIRREKEIFLDWMPDFHQSLFRRSVHGLAGNEFINYLAALEHQTTILSSVDYLSDRPALVILPTAQLPTPGAYIGVCGYWETAPALKQNDIFFGNEVLVLDE
jgi:hypothetical protein